MRTDLAKEAKNAVSNLKGVSEQIFETDGLTFTRIDVETPDAAEKLDKPIGTYVSVSLPEQAFLTSDARQSAVEATAKELRRMLPDGEILVIGLGNRYIAADALGTKTAEHILVTRHLAHMTKDLVSEPVRSVASFCTGVLGVTGIETVEIVSALTEKLHPTGILVIDSLAASSRKHIGTILQMNDTGISPGAGVGNFQTSLNRETLGVSVIAIGIPLVIGMQSLLKEVRDRLKPEETVAWPDDLASFTVTPKDIDLYVRSASKFLASVINEALHGNQTQFLQNLLQ